MEAHALVDNPWVRQNVWRGAAGAAGATLILPKWGRGGVTVALARAEEPWSEMKKRGGSSDRSRCRAGGSGLSHRRSGGVVGAGADAAAGYAP